MLEPHALSFANAEPGPEGAGVISVPYDRTASWGGGARNGPRAILDASLQLESYDELLGLDVSRLGIATYAPLSPSAEGPRAMARTVRSAVAEVLTSGRLPVLLGGDHSVTIGAVEAVLAHHRNAGVLQIDAHADMRDEYEGSRYSHACVMRRVREACEAVSVGIRSYSREEAEAVRESGATVIAPAALRTSALDRVLDPLPERVYVTIDVDGFDPSIMPATGTPEPGGLTWEEVDAVLEWIARRRRLIGFDVVELAPIPGFRAPDYLAARLVFRTIGRALASPRRG